MQTEIWCPGSTQVFRSIQPCILGIVRKSGVLDSLPKASSTRSRRSSDVDAQVARSWPAALGGGPIEDDQALGLVSFLKRLQPARLGAVTRQREWMRT